MTVLYRSLWFIEEHRWGVSMAVGTLVLASMIVLWLFQPGAEPKREDALRLQGGLRTVQEQTSRGDYCQALDTMVMLPYSDDTSFAQEIAAQRSYLLPGCQLQRELPTVDELTVSSDITRLQTAQHLAQHLLTKADAYLPLYRALLEKQRHIEQRIASEQQAQLHAAFWNHLQNQQWREAEALLQPLQGTMRNTYAGLLERSQRHAAWLEQGTLARGELRFEDAVESFQRIVQEGESPFVKAAATALTQMQAKLVEELKAFRTHQFPYKRTSTAVNFRAGPSASFVSYFTIQSGTVVALLDKVQRAGEPNPWARVRLTVPQPGHEKQLVGFIRSNVLIDYR